MSAHFSYRAARRAAALAAAIHPAPDLGKVLSDASALARREDPLAMRSPDFPAHEADAVVEVLTGTRLDWQWARELGPERAGTVHFAKSIVVLSSMLGARHGLTIGMAGILDDLQAPESAGRPDGYDPARRLCRKPPVWAAFPASFAGVMLFAG